MFIDLCVIWSSIKLMHSHKLRRNPLKYAGVGASLWKLSRCSAILNTVAEMTLLFCLIVFCVFGLRPAAYVVCQMEEKRTHRRLCALKANFN